MFERLKKVLVADDDEVFLRLVENDLAREGFAVIKTQSGKESIYLAKTQKPDLVLLDINMPDMNGGEVNAALKNDPRTKDVPVLFLTALLTKKEEAMYGHIIGGNFFMAKPYNVKALLAEIRKYI